MRNSKTLDKIRSGRVARICSLGAMIPYFPAMAAHYRFDGVFLDGEHRRWDSRSLESMLLLHQQADIDCIFRAPTLEKTGLCRLLEDGATGLMIPHVSTPQKAYELAQAVKFPPLGDRGLDGAGLDAGFLLQNIPEYIEQANRQTFLVVQIETAQAIDHVEAIAAIPGVEVLFIGPGDLSLRLGCKPSVEDPKFIKVYEKVASAARKHGKAWGSPAGDINGVRTLVNMGAQFITFGSDFAGIQSQLVAKSAELDSILRDN